MYNRITAQPDYQITKGEWYVREVLRVDEDNRQIYFSANGMEAGEDPYLIRYYRIGFVAKVLPVLLPKKDAPCLVFGRYEVFGRCLFYGE